MAARAAPRYEIGGRCRLSIPMSGRRRLSRALAGRRLAIVDGTTSWMDFALALRLVVARATLLDGEMVEEYERAFARRLGVRYAVSFASGRVGLYGLLMALGVE